MRAHGYSAHVSNPQAKEPGWAAEKVFCEERPVFSTLLLPAVDDAAYYQLVSMIAPVFESRGQIAFALGLTGFTQTTQGAEIRRIGELLVAACNRVSHFSTGGPDSGAA